jgi:nitrogen fixation protein NifQ
VSANANANAHTDFIHSLHALLLTHASPTVHAADAHCIATIIAHACLRPDHLWRDLGLAGRDEVTWMLTRYFPTLVAMNVANLRWKKFLAAQRALSLGLQPGPAPGCPGCEDYGYCFPRHR